MHAGIAAYLEELLLPRRCYPPRPVQAGFKRIK